MFSECPCIGFGICQDGQARVGEKALALVVEVSQATNDVRSGQSPGFRNQMVFPASKCEASL